ncbi:DUF262 domain-containing protein [Psychrobacillus glaciei]|uniref:DUF262 domain-containing protein n=1 Tax=Psychrobacillus glaciei TaxID=2283160 RepID=A0A5J6SPR6_9BACI|nr:DUF262 domain-containing protein [Psychrobacillus glaciei]QFF99935.1 DUF262 domain-containing protein [Psychrobacillus glaciei]
MRIIDRMQNEKKSTKWLIDSRRNGTLIVDNSYQRNYVWSLKDQIKLIETILLGFSIPEIYLHEKLINPDNGDAVTSIIDGQQRIGAIFDFINDEFSLQARYLKSSEYSFVDKNFSELSPTEKAIIWSYPFSSRVIGSDVNREDIVELFLRLNATDKSLNPQELRNAEFNGEFVKLAERVSEMEFWKKIFSPSRIRRMYDIEFISQILVYFRFGIENDLNQETINKAYAMFNDDYPKKEEDFIRFEEIINTLEKLSDFSDILRYMKKVTHLYALIIVTDYFLQNDIDFSEEIINRLNIFSKKIVGELNSDLKPTEESSIEEYLHLSLEGTKRKSNRIKRVNILKNFILEV